VPDPLTITNIAERSRQVVIATAEFSPRAVADAFGSTADRYFSYLALPDDQIEREFRNIIRAEHELPEPARYEMTFDRLRAWLELSGEDARILVRAYARALATFPEQYAREAAESERAVIFNAMTFDEFRTLSGLLPSLQSESWAIPLDERDEEAVEVAA
jgi:hypothetical protein